MSDEAEEEDDKTVTVRVRPTISVEQLQAAAKAPEVPSPPSVPIQKPDTATAREAFGENQPVPAANRGAMMGVALIGSIIAGVTVGFLVDKMTNNTGTPWGLIVGGVLGVLTGFVTMQNLAKSMKS